MKIGVVVGAGVAAVALGVADTAYRARTWGAYARESAMRLPGDDRLAEPADRVTRGVTVEAPPEVVWRWLVEVARVRGGEELPAERTIVLTGRADGSGREPVSSFHVLPAGPPAPGAGAARCRLVTRDRVPRRGQARRVLAIVFEPVSIVMTRRVLLGVKHRAEHEAREGTGRAAAVPAT